ncbi:hypothetical protein [Acinetobacter sp. Marseille-Q1618]|uniref:hypothetical protein n=1 Tax=Acinetobacter sp. Marseille-Q1618 TaxID=2697502 RepID=UPI00156FEB58|nr:hypothetical protein [Acinetobacter sp. Marseille-Q1618]
MWIKTDLESNKKALKKELFFWGGIAFLVLFFTILSNSCQFKSDLETKVKTPPKLYDSVTNAEIPIQQQWLVPFNHFKTDAIQVHELPIPIEQSLGENAWLSPSISIKYPTSQFYLYFDFAGQQSTRLDTEYYVLPICLNERILNPCFRIDQKQEDNYLIANTKSNTDYHTIEQNKSWLYYAHSYQGQYMIPPQESLKFLVNAEIPLHYQPSWVRITLSENPITPNKISFLLTQQYMTWFKYLLLLLPFALFYGFHTNSGFASRSALSIGGGLLFLMIINTMIWDINYMVIGCLCIAFAAIAYMYGFNLYILIYLMGYLTIAQGAYEQFGSFNKDFFMKTGLLTLIGLLLFFKRPDD